MSIRRLLVRAVVGLSLAAFLVPSLAAAAAFAPLPPLTATCVGAGQSHAAVVVQHSNGTVVTRCVAFSGPSIPAESLLKDSGIEYRVQSYGGFGDAICQVDAEPARYSDCLGKDLYWALFVAGPAGGWQFATTGISNATVRDGGAAGFRYEPQTGTAAAPPSPAGVCATAQPTPRPTPKPLPTQTPRPTPLRTTLPPTPSGATATAATSVEPVATASDTASRSTASQTEAPIATSAPSQTPTALATPTVIDAAASPAATSGGTGPNGGTGSSGGVPAGPVAAAAGGTALVALLALRSLRGRGRRR